MKVEDNPIDVVFTPDGTKAYVANAATNSVSAGSNTVSVINTGTNAISTTVTVRTNPVNATAF